MFLAGSGADPGMFYFYLFVVCLNMAAVWKAFVIQSQLFILNTLRVAKRRVLLDLRLGRVR